MITERGKTKITATLGPSTNTEPAIRALLQAGADCVRINFSHGDAEALAPLLAAAHKAAEAEKVPLPVLADIQGPKLRVGTLPPEGIHLREGETFIFTEKEVTGDGGRVHLPHPELLEEVKPGSHIFLSDGAMRVEVKEVRNGEIRTKVLVGGRLFSHKGINLPGLALHSVATLTPKDEKDLAYIARAGFDLVAVSFVRKAADIIKAREILGTTRIPVMAKIERPEAVQYIEEILAVSDGIMLARGDLGVELPLERVPLLQKEILAKASRAGKWVMVATQMLSSMTASPRPTRAEASDVANAIFDGADAIMLSEETATGAYAKEAVRTMARIAHEVESSSVTEIYRARIETAGFAGGAAGAAVHAAGRLGAKAIVALAGSGLTALLVSKQRPQIPILALSAKPATLRRLNVLWGILPVSIPDHAPAEEQIAVADKFLVSEGLASKGDALVSVAALPLGAGGETNSIRFHRVGEKI